jgi:DNA processing protein
VAIHPRLESRVLAALTAPGCAADAATRARAAGIARTLAGLGVQAIGRGEPGYPRAWEDLPDPPAVMFACGEPLATPGRSVAIVGARAATAYGTAVARRLAGDLCGLGYTVVSGLARGIDAAAHQSALEHGGRTVAVLPSGLDRVTPTHHHELARAIAAHGTLVSERACGGPRFRGEFVRRNRLIAALAAATVVVEAAPGSGALTTAGFARDLGRVVLAVPGDVDRPGSSGTHALIREGAILCENAGHVSHAIAAWTRARGGVSDESRETGARLLAAIGEQPSPVEEIAGRAGVPLAEALAGLLTLQWAGAVAPRPGQKWIRVGR